MRIVLVVIAGLVGCGSKDAERAIELPPTPGVPEPNGGATARLVTLPAPSGKPPAPTRSPHTKPELEALAKLELPGFTREVRSLDTSGFTILQRTTARPQIAVTVTVAPCMDCLAMKLDRWEAKGEALELVLAPELRDRTDTVFQVSELELGGAKAIATYQVGYAYAKDDEGSAHGTHTNSIAGYYNDGINQLRVITEYAPPAENIASAAPEGPPDSKEALIRAAPRAELERITRTWLDAYAQRWGN